MDLRGWLLITLDSCRFDSFIKAEPRKLLDRIGAHHVERRNAHATWTGPAHYSILSGLLPHHAEAEDTATTPDLYRGELSATCARLGLDRERMRVGFPAAGLWLPSWLQAEGYACRASTSLPVLGDTCALRRAGGWASWRRTSKHNVVDEHVANVLEWMTEPDARPAFTLVNVGETHYPYTCRGERSPEPVLHGLSGVARRLGSGDGARVDVARDWLTPERLDRFRRAQVEAVRGVLPALIEMVDAVPKGTAVTVTADHGEAFGEGGWFGHGPVANRAVLEVPFVEGLA